MLNPAGHSVNASPTRLRRQRTAERPRRAFLAVWTILEYAAGGQIVLSEATCHLLAGERSILGATLATHAVAWGPNGRGCLLYLLAWTKTIFVGEFLLWLMRLQVSPTLASIVWNMVGPVAFSNMPMWFLLPAKLEPSRSKQTRSPGFGSVVTVRPC